MRRKADYVDAELRALPEAVQGNLPAVVTEELGKFWMQLQKHIDGGSQSCPFQKDFHEIAMQFRHNLTNTKPILKLRDAAVLSRVLPTRETPNSSVAVTPTPTHWTRGPLDTSTIIDVSDDEDTSSPTLHRLGNKRANNVPSESPRKLQRTGSVSAQPSSMQKIQSKCFTLFEVRKIIHRGYISLPGQVDPKAIEELIRLSMEHWHKPLNDFFTNLKSLCKNTVMEQVQNVFGHRCQTKYFDEILEICDVFMEQAMADQFQTAQRLLSWELAKPKTLNERAMDQARDSATTLLRSQRRKILAERFLDEQEEKSGKKSTVAQSDEKLGKLPDDELVPEMFGPELNPMPVSTSRLCI